MKTIRILMVYAIVLGLLVSFSACTKPNETASGSSVPTEETTAAPTQKEPTGESETNRVTVPSQETGMSDPSESEVTNQSTEAQETESSEEIKETLKRAKERAKNNAYVVSVIKQMSTPFYDYRELYSGGVLLVGLQETDYNFGNPEPLKAFDYGVFNITDGKAYGETIIQPWGGPDAVLIFYDEDWEQKTNPAGDDEQVQYYSFFLWHSGPYGREVFIYVEPNESSLYPDYEHSPYYQQTPTDSLGTEPMYMFDDNTLPRYPAWMFVVSEEELTPEYELHYMDYVLTGEDILNNSWTIGNAPVKQIEPEYWEQWFAQYGN